MELFFSTVHLACSGRALIQNDIIFDCKKIQNIFFCQVFRIPFLCVCVCLCIFLYEEAHSHFSFCKSGNIPHFSKYHFKRASPTIYGFFWYNSEDLENLNQYQWRFLVRIWQARYPWRNRDSITARIGGQGWILAVKMFPEQEERMGLPPYIQDIWSLNVDGRSQGFCGQLVNGIAGSQGIPSMITNIM